MSQSTLILKWNFKLSLNFKVYEIQASISMSSFNFKIELRFQD